MILAELTKELQIQRFSGGFDLEIERICYDSRQASPNCLFVAVPGAKTDGHRYIAQAVSKGARAVVVQEGGEGLVSSLECTWIVVADSRRALAELAGNFYGSPSLKMGLIGVTGTNGKTTLTYLLESILTAWGANVGVIGTVDYRYRGRSSPAGLTTPESPELQALFSQMLAEKVDWVAMEVSSHALEMNRVAGCHFDGAVFTSFSQDHLDLHQTMDHYFQAKLRLFTDFLAQSKKGERRFAVINNDDPRGKEIARLCPCSVLTYGRGPGSTITMESFQLRPSGIEARLRTPAGWLSLRSSLEGDFNLYNLMAAAGVGLALGIPIATICQGLEMVKAVPGRMERVECGQDFTVIVDYGHTSDSLERSLKYVREICEKRLIVVFGCGGNRDHTKRPLMGEVAARLADVALVTSDNPRFEEPEAIISDILSGMGAMKRLSQAPFADIGTKIASEKGYMVVLDRKQAIKLAVELAKPGDMVLLAGKGHENYQIIGNDKLQLDDREEASSALRARLAGT